jgi:thioredoxin 1
MKKLIYFSATWCGPCKIFGPIMQQLSTEGISVEKIDVGMDQDSVSRYNIHNVPTVILMENGREKARFTGVKSKEEIKQFYGQ